MQNRLYFLIFSFLIASFTVNAQHQPAPGQRIVIDPPARENPGNTHSCLEPGNASRHAGPTQQSSIIPFESTGESNRVNSVVNLLDSSYYWRWDTLTGSWNYNRKFIYSYDSQYNQVNLDILNWDGAAFIESDRYAQTFDVNNNLTNLMVQYWNGLTWDNSQQTSYTYNASNQRISLVSQNWISGSWTNSYQYVFGYGVNNLPDTELYYRWLGGQWTMDQRHIYSYNVNNKVTTDLRDTWNGTAWVHAEQFSTGYDPNGNPISSLSQLWNGLTWTNYYLILSTYDGNNNLLSNIVQSWNAGAWVNSSQSASVYNANNSMISYMFQTWNGSAWQNGSYNQFSNDANNNRVVDVLQIWNGTSWLNRDSTYNYYTVITGLNEIAGRPMDFVVFPNPGNDKVVIHGCPPLTGGDITLCNQLGQTVLQKEWESGQTETTLNVKALPEGLYFVRIRGEAGSTDWLGTQRLVVSRR